MSDQLQGRTIAFIVANEGIEQVELTTPWEAVKQAGATAVLVAPRAGSAQAFNHLDKADSFEVDLTTEEASQQNFDGIVLPGGVANPDQLRTDKHAVQLVTDHLDSGKPLAAICHGPWTLIEAGQVAGRTLTSWPSLQTDIRNAGGNWVDQELCIDGQLITSRMPDDLEVFSNAIIEAVSSGLPDSKARL